MTGQSLATRIRKALAKRRNVTEKSMFGGLAFLVGGRMCCGVLGDDLVVRVAADRYDAALARPHVRPMDFTGRPMKGFIYVGPGGTKSGPALLKWLEEGIAAARAAKGKNKKA
jgi:TfoX/Sxy family transcriptional regulator of competence genes